MIGLINKLAKRNHFKYALESLKFKPTSFYKYETEEQVNSCVIVFFKTFVLLTKLEFFQLNSEEVLGSGSLDPRIPPPQLLCVFMKVRTNHEKKGVGLQHRVLDLHVCVEL